MEAVNRLPKKYRQVIYLYYIEGYATGEIAAILEMPQNTVLSQLAAGAQIIENCFEGGDLTMYKDDYISAFGKLAPARNG